MTGASPQRRLLQRFRLLLLYISVSVVDGFTVNARNAKLGPTDPGARYQTDSSHSICELIKFLDSEECEGLDTTEIGYNTDSGLRGIFAKKAFSPREFILAVPFVSTVVIDESVQEETSDVAKGLKLLHLLNTNDKWKPYWDCLPNHVNQFDATPDFWEQREIEQLQIPRLIQESLDRKKQTAEIAQNNGVTHESLQFATWLVRSRKFTTFKRMAMHDPNEKRAIRTRTVLIPYMDFLNHSSHHSNAEVQVIESDVDDESFYALAATRPISVGNEILISYGTGYETALDLFSKYGFFPTENQNDIHGDLTEVTWDTSLEEDEKLLETAEGVMKQVLELRTHLKRIDQQQKLTR